MNKILILLIIVVAIVILAITGVIGLQMFGLDNLGFGDDEQIEGAVDLGLTDREIYQALCFLTGKDLPVQDTLSYIDALHMEMYGTDESTAYETLLWYQNQYTNESYTSYASTVQTGTGWIAYHDIFYKDLNGKSITTGDGGSIKSFYGYDTVVLTGSGPVTTYYDFAVMVASS